MDATDKRHIATALRELQSAVTDLTNLVRERLPTRGATFDEHATPFDAIAEALDAAQTALSLLDHGVA